MEVIDDTKVLSDESANGVAPPADSSYKLVADNCAWLYRHTSGWQFGEQGVLEAIAHRLEEVGVLADDERFAVEFGGGDGSSETPVTIEPITKMLGWKSLLIEGDPHKANDLRVRLPQCSVLCEMVAPEGDKSIDVLVRDGEIKRTPSIMVIDVDSIDYYIVKSMAIRPRVVCVEVMDSNSPLNTNTAMYIPDIKDCGKRFDDKFGTVVQANAVAVDSVMVEHGYQLVFRSRINRVYVRNDTVEHVAKVCVNVGAIQIHEHIKASDPLHLEHGTATVDEVYVVPGVLDTIEPSQMADAFTEWNRVLRPNGILRVSTLDTRKVIDDLKSDDALIDQKRVQHMLYGSGPRAGFVRTTLMARMYAAGFGRITDFAPFCGDSSSDPYNMNLIGYKRAFQRIENPKVCLILSQPRFAFTGHEKALILLAQKMKFDIQESTGSFWDRDITLATMGGIAKYNPDFLLYSDYDSIFEPADVQLLLDTINNNPDIAAIGSIQPSRHHDHPLVLDLTLDYTTDITRVKFQHFGLTIIRREVFDELPQPWFWSVPGQDEKGEWDWQSWNRSDGDITFWRNLDILGFRTYQHNKVNIGHITQCVKYVRDKGKGVQLVPIENYWRHGKPKDAIFNADLYRTPAPAPPVTKEATNG